MNENMVAKGKTSRLQLNANQIKLMAIIAMTIDHLTWALWPGCQHVWYVFALHMIGRLTAPIMWFFIAEGCYYTRDIKKYALRLFTFAIVSHFAYCFAGGIELNPTIGSVFNRTSVMWPLALAVVLVSIVRREDVKQWTKYVCIFAFCLLAFPADWSSIAVMAPLFIYLHRDNRRRQMFDIVMWSFVYAVVYVTCIDKLYGVLQMFTFLSIPVLSMYNGQRGKWKGMKWLFYIYYPAHLFVIGLIRLALHGDIPIIF